MTTFIPGLGKLLRPMLLCLVVLGLTAGLACSRGSSDSSAAIDLTRPSEVNIANTEIPAGSATAVADGEAESPGLSERQTSGLSQSPGLTITPGLIASAHDQLMVDLYDRVVPSIVGLRVIKSTSAGANPSSFAPNEFLSTAAGSGFVWDDQGHVVTNRHVISDAERILVVMSDGLQTDAEIIGADADSDLAVIKIIDDSVRPVPIRLGNSGDIRPGQLAVAIGDPFSRGFSMTSGIVSAVGRTINPADSNFSVPRVIQHDAATNPGNSGGPLLDRNGEVIGINTQIISQTGAFSGIGLAVPVNLAKLIIPALIADGRYEYPYIGIRGTDISPDTAQAMGLPRGTRGALVLAVATNSAAHRGGLRPADQTTVVDGLEIPVGGDIIIAIDETQIRSMDDVVAYVVENTRPGDTATFTVLRDGTETELSITLAGRP